MGLVNLTCRLLWAEASSTCKLCVMWYEVGIQGVCVWERYVCGLCVGCVCVMWWYGICMCACIRVCDMMSVVCVCDMMCVWYDDMMCVCAHMHTYAGVLWGVVTPRLPAPSVRTRICSGLKLLPPCEVGDCRPAWASFSSCHEPNLCIPAPHVSCSIQVRGSGIIENSPSASFQGWTVSPSALVSSLVKHMVPAPDVGEPVNSLGTLAPWLWLHSLLCSPLPMAWWILFKSMPIVPPCL